MKQIYLTFFLYATLILTTTGNAWVIKGKSIKIKCDFGSLVVTRNKDKIDSITITDKISNFKVPQKELMKINKPILESAKIYFSNKRRTLKSLADMKQGEWIIVGMEYGDEKIYIEKSFEIIKRSKVYFIFGKFHYEGRNRLELINNSNKWKIFFKDPDEKENYEGVVKLNINDSNQVYIPSLMIKD